MHESYYFKLSRHDVPSYSPGAHFSKMRMHKNCVRNYELFTTKSRLLTTLWGKAFKNIVGKRENAGKQHFLLFLQCFNVFYLSQLKV